jgi:mRNA-degrading endonuclease toxin of MazEF toxin-antitoxin module
MQGAIRPMDIWMVSLTETVGSEQRGQRPAVVIAVHPQANVSMVVPLTSNIGASRFPYSHKIECSASNGLSADSIALVFQMRALTISAGRFLSKTGVIERRHFESIKALIKDYLRIE